MKKWIGLALVWVVLSGLLSGCADNSTNPGQVGTLKISLTDAPATFEGVNITFSEISAHIDDQWVSIRSDEPVTVDLLQWNNGKSIVIGTAEVPAGHYTQIRLKITGAEVRVDGKTYPLFIPSGAQSGLKLLVNFDVNPGSTYELVLDFDVNRSIVTTGPANQPHSYLLKPTIRVVPKATTGSISGTVTNPENLPIAYAITTANDTVTSTNVMPDGNFMLAFLPEGIYQVAVRDTLNRQFLKDSVEVVAGNDVNIGAITLE